MAYKFQRGAAILSGALTQKNNITVDSANALATGNLVPDGNFAQVLAGADVQFNYGAIILTGSNSHGVQIEASSGGAAVISASANMQDPHASVQIKRDSGNTVLFLGQEASASATNASTGGLLKSYDTDGTTVLAYFSGSDGSGQVTSLAFGDDGEIAGNLAIGGDLFVNGTTTTLNTNNLQIDDDIVQIAMNSTSKAGSVESAVQFGTTSGQIAQIAFRDGADYTDVNNASIGTTFALVGDSETDLDIDIRATKFYGNGAGITGGTGATQYTVTEKHTGETLSVGVNYLTSSAAAQALNMLNSSGVAVGTVVKFKSYGNHSSTNKITITRQGSDTIDGENAIIIENAFAAITMIKTDANKWSIV